MVIRAKGTDALDADSFGILLHVLLNADLDDFFSVLFFALDTERRGVLSGEQAANAAAFVGVLQRAELEESLGVRQKGPGEGGAGDGPDAAAPEGPDAADALSATAQRQCGYAAFVEALRRALGKRVIMW